MTALWIVVAIVVVVGITVVGLNLLTTWVMGGSLTKVRLGPPTRWGRCPVGHHWIMMHPVKDADLLTNDERHQLHGKARA